MKKFAQIYQGKVYWIFEAEEVPDFAPNIVLIEITGREDIQEGWVFDGMDFSPPDGEPEKPEPTIEQITAQTLLNTEFLVVLAELENL